MDLIEAEDKLPPSINPLSLHIMRLTSEYVRFVVLFCFVLVVIVVVLLCYCLYFVSVFGVVVECL